MCNKVICYNLVVTSFNIYKNEYYINYATLHTKSVFTSFKIDDVDNVWFNIRKKEKVKFSKIIHI